MGLFPLFRTSASLKYGPFQTALACCEVPANARLSGSLQLIIFFLKTRRRENPRSRREAQRSLWHQTARANAAKVCVCSQLSAAGNPTPSQLPSTASLALVPGMLNPVTDHPLLARAPLDDQTKTEIRIFGHFHLQASARVPADDWTVLELKEDMKI